MSYNTNKQWYALYVRPGWEKKVVDTLRKKKFDAYCPLNKIARQWHDRRKILFEPLFTSYVFVYTSEKDHVSMKQTDGIINFVYWLSQPAVIRDEEIDTIKKFLIEYDCVHIEKTEINLQDKVRIINGPLMMWEGNVVEIKTTTVKIILPSLGYTLSAEITKENSEKVRSIKGVQTKAV